ncbi:MAG: ABC transporter ATP-binding protein [Phycisphaerales bacterium]
MLTLTNIRKTFGKPPDAGVVAVDGLSLEVRPGEVFGLLGPNGAGKSTTISIAVGLLRPDSGDVTLATSAGIGSPEDPRFRALIGVAPQQIALYDDLSADENLRFFGSLYDLSGPALASRTSELLRLVGLTDRRRDRIKGYSGGMKRRLNLAAAVLHNPPLVMLDEPTAGVDPQSRAAILDIVRSMKSAGTTILYTTHYMEEAQRVCDRVGIIDHGRLLALGSVEQLITSHGGKSAVIVEELAGSAGASAAERRIDTDDPAAEMLRHLRNPLVRGVRVERPDLESVFLSLTGRSLRDS